MANYTIVYQEFLRALREHDDNWVIENYCEVNKLPLFLLKEAWFYVARHNEVKMIRCFPYDISGMNDANGYGGEFLLEAFKHGSYDVLRSCLNGYTFKHARIPMLYNAYRLQNYPFASFLEGMGIHRSQVLALTIKNRDFETVRIIVSANPGWIQSVDITHIDQNVPEIFPILEEYDFNLDIEDKFLITLACTYDHEKTMEYYFSRGLHYTPSVTLTTVKFGAGKILDLLVRMGFVTLNAEILMSAIKLCHASIAEVVAKYGLPVKEILHANNVDIGDMYYSRSRNPSFIEMLPFLLRHLSVTNEQIVELYRKVILDSRWELFPKIYSLFPELVPVSDIEDMVEMTLKKGELVAEMLDYYPRIFQMRLDNLPANQRQIVEQKRTEIEMEPPGTGRFLLIPESGRYYRQICDIKAKEALRRICAASNNLECLRYVAGSLGLSCYDEDGEISLERLNEMVRQHLALQYGHLTGQPEDFLEMLDFGL